MDDFYTLTLDLGLLGVLRRIALPHCLCGRRLGVLVVLAVLALISWILARRKKRQSPSTSVR